MEGQKKYFTEKMVMAFCAVLISAGFLKEANAVIIRHNDSEYPPKKILEIGDCYACYARDDSAIVPGNYCPETLAKGLWFNNYDFINESPQGNERENLKGYNFITGKKEYWDWIYEGNYNRIDNEYYAPLDKGIFCYGWDGWPSFYDESFRDMQIYYRPSELLDPRFYGFASIVGEKEYYKLLNRGYHNWLDWGYYRCLDRGCFPFRPAYIIPEPSTSGFLVLGLLIFLRKKKLPCVSR